jgi:hypothetical protein
MYRHFVGKPHGKRPTGTSEKRSDDTIKTDVREIIRCELAHNFVRYKWCWVFPSLTEDQWRLRLGELVLCELRLKRRLHEPIQRSECSRNTRCTNSPQSISEINHEFLQTQRDPTSPLRFYFIISNKECTILVM